MNAPLPKPDHRTLPRKKRPPSARDEAIYLLKSVKGWTQQQLAAEFRLSQSRVSQVLRRYEAWRAAARPQSSGELDHAQQQRVERWLEKKRYEELYERSMRDYDAAPRRLKTIKSSERDGKPFRETTVREVQRPVQLLRIAQRAAQDLGQAAEKPPLPLDRDPQAEAHASFRMAEQTLCRLRREAEEAGRAPRSQGVSNDGYDVYHTVQAWLGALLGKPSIWVGPQHIAPGTPLAELSQSYAAQQTWGGMAGVSNPSNPTAAETAQAEAPPEDADGCQSLTTLPASSGATNGCASHGVSRGGTASPAVELGAGTPDPRTTEGTKAHSRPKRPTTLAASSTGGEPDAAERRRLHMEKLREWEIARRRGLPCSFLFDPADGPLPPRYVHLDGAPCP